MHQSPTHHRTPAHGLIRLAVGTTLIATFSAPAAMACPPGEEEGTHSVRWTTEAGDAQAFVVEMNGEDMTFVPRTGHMNVTAPRFRRLAPGHFTTTAPRFHQIAPGRFAVTMNGPHAAGKAHAPIAIKMGDAECPNCGHAIGKAGKAGQGMQWFSHGDDDVMVWVQAGEGGDAQKWVQKLRDGQNEWVADFEGADGHWTVDIDDAGGEWMEKLHGDGEHEVFIYGDGDDAKEIIKKRIKLHGADGHVLHLGDGDSKKVIKKRIQLGGEDGHVIHLGDGDGKKIMKRMKLGGDAEAHGRIMFMDDNGEMMEFELDGNDFQWQGDGDGKVEVRVEILGDDEGHDGKKVIRKRIELKDDQAHGHSHGKTIEKKVRVLRNSDGETFEFEVDGNHGDIDIKKLLKEHGHDIDVWHHGGEGDGGNVEVEVLVDDNGNKKVIRKKKSADASATDGGHGIWVTEIDGDAGPMEMAFEVLHDGEGNISKEKIHKLLQERLGNIEFGDLGEIDIDIKDAMKNAFTDLGDVRVHTGHGMRVPVVVDGSHGTFTAHEPVRVQLHADHDDKASFSDRLDRLSERLDEIEKLLKKLIRN